MTEHRFVLRWDRPTLPGASTHVSLFDGGDDPLNIVASGHGADDPDALNDLLQALSDRRESGAAIAYVRDAQAALGARAFTHSGR